MSNLLSTNMWTKDAPTLALGPLTIQHRLATIGSTALALTSTES